MPTAETVVDFILIGVGITLVLVSQFALVSIMEPTKDTIQDNSDNLAVMNGEQAMDDMFEAAVKWVPFIGGVGMIVIALVRQYRRERVTASRTVR